MNDYSVTAFIAGGSWVARCPRAGCFNAEKYGVCDDGSLGGLRELRFICREDKGGCGFTCRVRWPEDRAAIENLLSARELRANRNWLPGESVADIHRENLDHGIREGA